MPRKNPFAALACCVFIIALAAPLKAGQFQFDEAMNRLLEIEMSFREAESSGTDTLNALYGEMAKVSTQRATLQELEVLYLISLSLAQANVHQQLGQWSAAAGRLEEARFLAGVNPELTELFAHDFNYMEESAKRLKAPLAVNELNGLSAAQRLEALAQGSGISRDKDTGADVVTAVVRGDIARIAADAEPRAVWLVMAEGRTLTLELAEFARLDPDLAPGSDIIAQCAYNGEEGEEITLRLCTLFMPPSR